MMQKNEEYHGLVEALGSGGEGIIKIGGTTAFVPFCLVGERVSFKVLKVKGNIAYGKLLSVITPSPERVKPACPVFGKCGGCDLQHMSYSAQLDFKRETVKNCLQKIGGISAEVNETVACDMEYRYRNKLVLPISVDEKGETVVGFYAQRSHRIVPVSDCPIQSEWVKDIISAVLEFSKESGLCGYDEVTKKGILRRIAVRELKGKFIIALVAQKDINADKFIQILKNKFKNFTLLLNINCADDNLIFSDKWRICRGEGHFEAEDMGIKFSAGANTFVQVNDDMRSKLYSAVLNAAQGADAAVDLYSGGGMLTAMLAKTCGKAYGIEIVKEASACADELKERNNLSGKMFNICGSVEDNIGKVLKDAGGAHRVIVCDPPRKGMERSVVKAVTLSGAEKVILISCNPATLARDLGLLCGTLEERDGELVKSCSQSGAYDIVSVTPFDMFPQTKHIETLVTLFHKKPDSHIEVTVDFENGKIKKDGIIERAESKKPKEKPTYKMIQKWVEENYGLKVHTAYIAEVKRDLGLPMYDAPNAVEELKRPRAHPTQQMVEAIKAALKHFEIIV